MNTNALLDAVKARLQLTSDNQLAHELGYTRQHIADMRARGMSAPVALQIATLLELPAEEVLTAIEAERERDPAVKAVRKKIAESMRRALALAAFVVVALLLTTPPNVAHASQGALADVHIMRRRVRRFLSSWGILRGFGGSIISPMRTWTFAACLTLAACGGGSSSSNNSPDYGSHYDSYSGTGVRVRYYDALSPQIDTVTRWYLETRECVARIAYSNGDTGAGQRTETLGGPLVIFVHTLDRTDHANGIYDLNSATIVVEQWYLATWGSAGLSTISTNTKHEFVHYILHQTGRGWRHEEAPAEFRDCTAPTP